MVPIDLKYQQYNLNTKDAVFLERNVNNTYLPEVIGMNDLVRQFFHQKSQHSGYAIQYEVSNHHERTRMHEKFTLLARHQGATPALFSVIIQESSGPTSQYGSSSGAMGSTEQLMNDFGELIEQWLINNNDLFKPIIDELVHLIGLVAVQAEGIHTWLVQGDEVRGRPTVVEVHLHNNSVMNPGKPEHVIIFQIKLVNRFY